MPATTSSASRSRPGRSATSSDRATRSPTTRAAACRSAPTASSLRTPCSRRRIRTRSRRTRSTTTSSAPPRRSASTGSSTTFDTAEAQAMEVEIGIGKSGRRAYGFDDIAIVPSRRTRDPEDVDITWQLAEFTFELPMMASAMDGVVSPATAIEIGRLGGLACLNLEGLWTRYDNPEPILAEIAALPPEKATRRMQELYQEPLKPQLIGTRI